MLIKRCNGRQHATITLAHSSGQLCARKCCRTHAVILHSDIFSTASTALPFNGFFTDEKFFYDIHICAVPLTAFPCRLLNHHTSRQGKCIFCRFYEKFYRNRFRSFSNESSRREMSVLSSCAAYLPPSVIR